MCRSNGVDEIQATMNVTRGEQFHTIPKTLHVIASFVLKKTMRQLIKLTPRVLQ